MIAAWWTGSGADSRIDDEFDTATISQTTNPYSNPLWDLYTVYGGQMTQRAFHHGSSYDKWNGGFFYLKNNDTDEDVDAGDSLIVVATKLTTGSGDDAVERFGDGKPVVVWLPIVSGSSTYFPMFEFYVTSTPPGSAGNFKDFNMRHYSPWAWKGTTAEVVASILLQVGIDEDYIDTDAFDNAYDGQKADYGTGGDPDLLVSRIIGERVIDTIKRVATHFRDGLYFAMDGKIAMSSRSRPESVTSVDGIVSAEWRIAREHLCNTVRFTYGEVSRCKSVDHGHAPTEFSGDEVVKNDTYNMECSYEPSAGALIGSAYVVEDSNAASVTDFGEVPIGGEGQVIIEGDEVRTVPTTHLPYHQNNDDVAVYAARVDDESDEMREVTLVQDMRGIDFDIGYKLSNLQVTGDGSTISDLRCIAKTINFDTMTVESVLLEAL